jgi:hypothetical protein
VILPSDHPLTERKVIDPLPPQRWPG